MIGLLEAIALGGTALYAATQSGSKGDTMADSSSPSLLDHYYKVFVTGARQYNRHLRRTLRGLAGKLESGDLTKNEVAEQLYDAAAKHLKETYKGVPLPDEIKETYVPSIKQIKEQLGQYAELDETAVAQIVDMMQNQRIQVDYTQFQTAAQQMAAKDGKGKLIKTLGDILDAAGVSKNERKVMEAQIKPLEHPDQIGQRAFQYTHQTIQRSTEPLQRYGLKTPYEEAKDQGHEYKKAA